MPDDKMYLPIHVGAEGKDLDLGFVKDNTGDNISAKNKNYCELTGLYWAWKNLDAEYLGLAHYRRHFSTGSLLGDKKSRVICQKELENKLLQAPILLPKRRNYWIETNYSQYAHSHHAEDLDLTRIILQEMHPEYVAAFDASMKKTTGHRFNMFVMRKDFFDDYCAWLFDVLFALEERLDISGYSKYDARVFGFVSERLLDVWIETNRLPYLELPYVFMEKQNWVVKGGRFIMRKLSKAAK